MHSCTQTCKFLLKLSKKKKKKKKNLAHKVKSIINSLTVSILCNDTLT